MVARSRVVTGPFTAGICAGSTSMPANDAQTVRKINSQARSGRVTAANVAGMGVTLADGYGEAAKCPGDRQPLAG